MSNELITQEKLESYLDIFGGSGLTQKEKQLFIEIAKLNNLNPFKREIYINAYGEGQYRTLSIVVGYETYLKRAEANPNLDGWQVEIVGKIPDMIARITIHRKDRSKPFIHEVHYSEYVQRKKDGSINKFWAEKPITMLKKVVISQGFRMCFPLEFDGMPYTEAEMPIPEKEVNQYEPQETKALPSKTNQNEESLQNLKSKLQGKNLDFDKISKTWENTFKSKKIDLETYNLGCQFIAEHSQFISELKSKLSIIQGTESEESEKDFLRKDLEEQKEFLEESVYQLAKQILG